MAKGTGTTDMTDRRRQVLTHIVRGSTYKEVADELGISERTVQGHALWLLRWYNVRRREQLAARLCGFVK